MNLNHIGWALTYLYLEWSNKSRHSNAETQVLENSMLFPISSSLSETDTNDITGNVLTATSTQQREHSGNSIWLDANISVPWNKDKMSELDLTDEKSIINIIKNLRTLTNANTGISGLSDHIDYNVTFFHELASIFVPYYTHIKGNSDPDIDSVKSLIKLTYYKFRGYRSLQSALSTNTTNSSKAAVSCENATTSKPISVGTIDERRYVHAAFIESLHEHDADNNKPVIYSSRFTKIMVDTSNNYSVNTTSISNEYNATVITRWAAPKGYASRINKKNDIIWYEHRNWKSDVVNALVFNNDVDLVANVGDIRNTSNLTMDEYMYVNSRYLATQMSNEFKLTNGFKDGFTGFTNMELNTLSDDVKSVDFNNDTEVVFNVNGSTILRNSSSTPLGYISDLTTYTNDDDSSNDVIKCLVGVEYDLSSESFYSIYKHDNVYDDANGVTGKILRSANINTSKMSYLGVGELDKFISLGTLEVLNGTSVLGSKSTIVFYDPDKGVKIFRLQNGDMVIKANTYGNQLYDWLSKYMIQYDSSIKSNNKYSDSNISIINMESSISTSEVMRFRYNGNYLSTKLTPIYTVAPGFRDLNSFSVLQSTVTNKDGDSRLHSLVRHGCSFDEFTTNMSYLNTDLKSTMCQVVQSEIDNENDKVVNNDRHTVLDISRILNRPMFEMFRYELYDILYKANVKSEEIKFKDIADMFPANVHSFLTASGIEVSELVNAIDINPETRTHLKSSSESTE